MKILVVAGEASADLHAGHIFEAFSREKKFSLLGIGGDHLLALGLKPSATAKDMAVVGLTEAISKVPQTLRLLRELDILAVKEKPDLAFLVDLPDFNLRLAPLLKSQGIPVIYYVSPQVWAWRSKRVFAMAKCIDRLLCILPFEKKWYAENAPKELQVEYVGHPAIEEIPDLPYLPEKNLIAILPGSREREVFTLFPEMITAATLLKRENPALRFVIPLASILRKNSKIREFMSANSPNPEVAEAFQKMGNDCVVVEKAAHEILRTAKFAFVASGTATLETALVGTPMLVAYRVSGISAFIFKRFVNFHGPIAMANILHCGVNTEERIVPELLQQDATAEKIADAARVFLNSPEKWQELANTLAKTRAMLSGGVGSPTENVLRELRNFS